ncbi:FAD-binding oxidoreductase [Legionella gresilensis]|uniref:FAD-binding oxidoreductase n=1 Tax=Legionella gresilensis TaxID=91823 RepID=UPI001041AB4A|nr:FAD-binding oxidoreductase [Legionella gresilensis]
MRSKKMLFSNFTQAVSSNSECYRPEREPQLAALFNYIQNTDKTLLARGKGLSYSDCCLNQNGIIVDTSRFNHFLSFDKDKETIVCQPAITFADLLSVHPSYIPPVIPGTLHATLGGGIANDVHGKNNIHLGTLGQHVQWLELQIGEQTFYCSNEENQQLFQATIGGLGLTGVIKRMAIKMRQASRTIKVQIKKYYHWDSLLNHMENQAENNDYMVAWLDFLNDNRALLTFGNHYQEEISHKTPLILTVPSLPLRLITRLGMKIYNQYYFHQAKEISVLQSVSQFNNPLDSIQHWNRLYGKQGLLQFQGLFNPTIAIELLAELQKIINHYHAVPTLAVLKYFKRPASGLLSFVEPGFTLAIDFINNKQAKYAIEKMNQLITDVKGKIYLAKDLFLTREQFESQYPNHQSFCHILGQYSPQMSSNLSCRLGLTL